MARITKRMRYALDQRGQRIPLRANDGTPVLVTRGKHRGAAAFKKEVWLDQQGRPVWDAVVYLGRHPATGKPLPKQDSFPTEKEAQQWARKLEGQRDEGYRPATTKLTLAAYLRDTWLPNYRTQVRNTYNLEKTLGKWVLNPPKTLAGMPPLGGIALHKLTVGDFNRFYVAMGEQQHMQARGIEHLHGLLKRALKATVASGELPRNPAEFATLPKHNVKAVITTEADEDAGEVDALTREQAERFLAAAATDRYTALWYVLLTGGLRPGEAFALQWRHVDVRHSLVKVRGTLTRLGVDKKKLGWEITLPKTKTSKRDVPLPKIAMQALQHWKVIQAQERSRMGAEWQDHGFVFTTETGTPLGNNMQRLWERVMRAAGLGTFGNPPAKPRSGPTGQAPFTPCTHLYTLRHTCATLLLLDGVDLLEVSRRLGHTDLAFTARTYGHVKGEHSTRSAESFDRMFAQTLA